MRSKEVKQEGRKRPRNDEDEKPKLALPFNIVASSQPATQPARPENRGYQNEVPIRWSSGGSSNQRPGNHPKDPDFDDIPYAGCMGEGMKLIQDFAIRLRLNWLYIVCAIVIVGDLSHLLIATSKPALDIERDFPSNRWTSPALVGALTNSFTKAWRVLEEVQIPKKRKGGMPFAAAANVFPVLKRNGRWRAIVDSRDAGALCMKPPPIHLPLVSEVVEGLEKASWFWTADLKHWFYQIPIATSLRDMFTVRSKGKPRSLWRLLVLPMGWTWSPYLAQSIGWSIILYTDPHDADSLIFDPISLPKFGPPKWFPIMKDGQEVGRVYLWIDNIMVCGSDYSVVSDWMSHIKRNARRLGAKWSEADLNPGRVASYVGIQVERPKSSPQTRWRHPQSKVDKASELLLKLNSKTSLTRREVMTMTGLIVWNYTLTLTPLAYAHESLKISALITQEVKKFRDWDKATALREGWKTTLTRELARIRANEWQTLTPKVAPDQVKVLYICVDAATSGQGGAVLMHENLSECVAVEFPYTSNMSQWPINDLELWTAVKAMGHYAKNNHKVVLGIDNTAARSYVNHGTSSSVEAINLLVELMQISCYELQTVFLFSEDNLADAPSRREDISEHPKRHEESWKILTGSHVYNFLLGEKPSIRAAKTAVNDLSHENREELARDRVPSWLCNRPPPPEVILSEETADEV